MNDFIYWLIFSALALMLFFGIYRLLLNRIALLNAGRVYLLITMLMAIIIPLPWQRLMENPAEIAIIVNLDMATVFAPIVQTSNDQSFNWMNLLPAIYFVPAILLFAFSLFSNLRLVFVMRRGEKLKKQNSKIILLDRNLLPFSWFGIIVISRRDYYSPHADSIIAHELTHIRQRHFIDLLIAEVLIVLQWFNPAAWSYRNAIRDVHEYLADKGTIQSGFKIIDYQHLLASLVGPVAAGILSNNIKHSILKTRFIMMTKTQPGTRSKLRLLSAMILVIFGGWLIFSACQSNTDKNKTQQPAEPEANPGAVTSVAPSNPNADTIYILVDEPPVFTGGDEARINYIKENVHYPQEARDKGVAGTVYVQFVVEADGSVSNTKILRGIGSGCDEEARRVVENMPTWKPGVKDGKSVRVSYVMPIRFTLN